MRLPAVVLALAIAVVSPGRAQVMDENACRLQHLQGVRSNVAVGLIGDACNFLAGWSSTMELNRRERLYNECLLRSLQGVQNDQAAILIAQACRNASLGRSRAEGPPMITLFHFGDRFGFDPSPFCLKLDAYLKLAKLPFEKRRADLRKSPKGQLPYISDDGRVVADSRFVIEYLKATYGDPLDGHLAPREAAELHAWQRMLEESLYWILVYSRWIDDAGWRQFAPMVFDFLPRPLRAVVPALVRRRVRRTLHGQGTLRHGPDEVYALGRRDVDALATLLGDRPYMLGDRPTSLDATATGFLLNILQAPIETRLKADSARHAHLVAYAERMRAIATG